MKRIRIILIVVAVIAVGTVAVAIYRGKEPRYQGRTLSKWVEDGKAAADKFLDTPFNDYGQLETDPAWQTASHAVKEIGTNALPWLLKWAVTKDSAAKERLLRESRYWSWRYPWFHPPIKPALVSHLKAVAGFSLLGSMAQPAWPTLLHWTYSTDRDKRFWALICLTASKPEKNTLLPVLTRLIHDSDEEIRDSAAQLLVERYPQDAKASGVYKLFPKWKHELQSGMNTNRPPAR